MRRRQFARPHSSRPPRSRRPAPRAPLRAARPRAISRPNPCAAPVTIATLPLSRPPPALVKRNAAAIRLDFPIFDEQSLAVREIADAAEPRRPGHHLHGVEIHVAGRVRLLEVVADGEQADALDEHDLRRETACAADDRRSRHAAARRAPLHPRRLAAQTRADSCRSRRFDPASADRRAPPLCRSRCRQAPGRSPSRRT